MIGVRAFQSNLSSDALYDLRFLYPQDGISLTESAHGAKEFSITDMKGDYRRVFQRPVDFVWELLTYTDDNIPSAETDLDVISKVRPDAVMVDETIHGNYDYKSKDENEEMSMYDSNTAEDANKCST
ncbi:hypothetical protein J5N97_010751 [Dioscorea zingiberensis]|uniref:Uncharacterized protein n=1 Tax=Dioscorea zingiberensis TaxID=325984 RepID=A0A9D5CZQ4_9LILI|nr:hypothetical protein J5N97_010751 [Dioscorea zingiberensis]